MKFTPWDNPMGTDGFEFIEYAAPDPGRWARCSSAWAFTRDRAAPPQGRDAVPAGRRSTSSSTPSRDSFAQRFARQHGPSVCAIAFRVQDATHAYERAIEPRRLGLRRRSAGPGELNIPAIKGIGDSLIYLVDRWRGKNGAKEGDIGNIGFYDVDFEPLPGASAAAPAGARPALHRPPDAQRAPRPHEGMGGLLRAPVQFPRDPLLRHRGQGDRA